MGIHGLSFFIKSYPTLVHQQTWKINETKSTITDHFIMDGNAFVHHVAFENRTHWIHGGQYASIAETVTQIVDTCHRAGIQLTFLFDGALPQDKIETRTKRHKSYIERCTTTFHSLQHMNASIKRNQDDAMQYYSDLFLIPPLTLEVVIQTLKELHVTVRICQAEADGEVVTLANEKGAYVVSQDSDMHVFPHVGKGYISLDQLQIPLEGEEGMSPFVSAAVFHPEALARLLHLEPYHLPLLGTLLGNDYLAAEVIRLPLSQWGAMESVQTAAKSSWPKMVAELIRKSISNSNNNNNKTQLIEHIVHQLKPLILKGTMKLKDEVAETLEDRIRTSISRYDASSPLLTKQIDPIETTTTTADQQQQCRGEFSRQVLDIVRSQTFWASVLLEDIERECSWDVSRALREALYGAVLADKEHHPQQVVIEYIRVKQHLETVQVQGKKDVLQKNKPYFYQCHVCTYADLSAINTKLHPTILCLRSMIYHCANSIDRGRLANHEVVALVIASLRSLAPILVGMDDVKNTTTITTPSLKKRSLHVTAQYQSTLYSSYLLSQILAIPDYLHSPHVLSHAYHGIYFHYYLEMARGGSSIGGMLHGTSAAFKDLFCSVYKVVTHQREQDIEQVFDYNGTMTTDKPKRIITSQKVSSLRPEKKKKLSLGTSKNRGNNAFNVLSFGCNFDD